MIRDRNMSLFLLSALALLAGAEPAFAHVGPGEHGGLTAGLLHPVLGLDHLLAMVAVGVWAARMGGKALWIVPSAFVGTMAIGGTMGYGHAGLPGMELAIAGSVVVLGLLIATAARPPVAVGAAIVGLFAFFHGWAHGAEMPVDGEPLLFGLGFIVATALLHGLGIGAATLAARLLPSGLPTRALGAATAVVGAYLLVAA